MRPSAFDLFANYTRQPRCLLEACRVQLHVEVPVLDGGHKAYAGGEADTGRHQYCRWRCAAHD